MSSVVKDYFELVKFRLTSTVVATSAFGYILGCKINNDAVWTSAFKWDQFLGVFFGGLFIVFASNGLNQVIEKENDGKMDRTSNRPVADGRLSISNARLFSLLCGVVGVLILAFFTNFTTTLLGFVSLVIYVFIYTPMKQISSLSVMVGAFPGALPPLIGYTAVTGTIDEPGMILFLVQFFWQFPHFWAIAWLLHDDYQKAGYWMLPSKGGRDKRSGYQILIYTVLLVLISLWPVYYGMCKIQGLYLILPIGLFFTYKAIILFKTLEISDARKLLYASFLYTPVVFLAYILF
jgi:heme o synthase